MRLLLSDIAAAAPHRPPGFIEALLSHGSVIAAPLPSPGEASADHVNWLDIPDTILHQLQRYYGTPLTPSVHCPGCGT